MKKGRISKVTPENLCKAFNTLRQQYVGQKLISEQIVDMFQKENISKWIIYKMLQNSTLFTKIQKDSDKRCRGYIMPSNPVNIHWFENWLKDQHSTTSKKEEKKTLTLEEECIAYLKQQGFQMKKPKGFNVERFSKDYPQLYEKYLEFEIV